ncbi:MAG TPA: acyltransferase [Acidobacteriaceae bacterium]
MPTTFPATSLETPETSVALEPSEQEVATATISVQAPPARRSHLDALTGMRALAALNILFFHFSDPKLFGPFAPVVDNGYVSVSFFLLLSGFVLAYNYRERAERGLMSARTFWKARFSRIYPVFLFSLICSVFVLQQEWRMRSHGQFTWGVLLTLLLMQGWSPTLSTFWNTPAWTLTTDVFFYALFPWLVTLRRPRTRNRIAWSLLAFWCLSFILPALYTLLSLDGDPHPGRYSNGSWLRFIKFGPLQHLPSFLFGMALASLNDLIPERSRLRIALGIGAFSALYVVLYFGSHMPYLFMHDGLLMPLYGMIVLALAGRNFIARLFSIYPLIVIGEASYCLYILHFNVWLFLHDDTHIIERAGLLRFDPWLSYVIIVSFAVAAMYLVERPGQRWIRRWLHGGHTPAMPPSVP